MKRFAFALCIVIAVTIANTHAASLSRVRRQVVPKEFANINIENYLKNERAVQFQLKCIVYDGPCDRIGKYLKVTIPELLTNQCQNCEPAQRQRAGRLVQHIQQKFPKEWSDAVQKFQGGQVKKEDADRLESILGVKLDSKLIAPSPSAEVPVAAPVSSTAAPIPTTEVTSTTTIAPVSSSSLAPVSSTAVPEVSTSLAPAVSSTVAVPVSSSSVSPVASSTATVSSTSAVPVTSEASTASTTSTVPPPKAETSSIAPTV